MLRMYIILHFWLMENRPSNILILNREKVSNGVAELLLFGWLLGWRPSTCFIRRPWRSTSCQKTRHLLVSQKPMIYCDPWRR
jgi:hypothetical protein